MFFTVIINNPSFLNSVSQIPKVNSLKLKHMRLSKVTNKP